MTVYVRGFQVGKLSTIALFAEAGSSIKRKVLNAQS
jgi:hypothetical protein